MHKSWMNLLMPILSTCLLAGDSVASRSPQREVFGFQGSNVDIVFFNPDPSSWKPYDLGNEPRPDSLNRTLRHKGIRDSKGVNIQPAMFITAWKFPGDDMTLEYFANYLLKDTPVKVSKRVMKNGRLYVDGTAVYGGYTHIIRRAFSFHNRVGIDIMCDSTDSVYPEVKVTFDSWLSAAVLSPRITPKPVLSPAPAPAEGKDDVVVTTTTLMEKQKPGGTLGGEVAGIKDSDGMVIIWNQSAPYFTLKVEGNKFAGYGQGRALFTVDEAMLQIQSTELKDFCPDARLQDPELILSAHRDWEFRYMEGLSGVKCALHSWSGKLEDGTPVLYWDVTPEKVTPGGAVKHLFCTRYQAGSVISVYSAEDKKVSLDQAKNLVYYAISHIEFSPKKFDMKEMQKQITTNKK